MCKPPPSPYRVNTALHRASLHASDKEPGAVDLAVLSRSIFIVVYEAGKPVASSYEPTEPGDYTATMHR